MSRRRQKVRRAFIAELAARSGLDGATNPVAIVLLLQPLMTRKDLGRGLWKWARRHQVEDLRERAELESLLLTR